METKTPSESWPEYVSCIQIIQCLLYWIDGGVCPIPDNETISFGITAKSVRKAAIELGLKFKEPSDFTTQDLDREKMEELAFETRAEMVLDDDYDSEQNDE